jgi:nucleosome binding factor SPN SPT16 subunit
VPCCLEPGVCFSPSEFPSDLRPCQLFVDRKTETLLVPIAGMHVPFHISTIKSVSKSEEGPVTFLRLNFYAPGVSHGKDVSPSMMAALTANPDAMYIRMINLKSKVWVRVGIPGATCHSIMPCLQDPKNINTQLRLIKDMQKRMRSAQEEERETQDVVKQADLHVEKGVRVPVLPVRFPWVCCTLCACDVVSLHPRM